jgi:hypothetical protein
MGLFEVYEKVVPWQATHIKNPLKNRDFVNLLVLIIGFLKDASILHKKYCTKILIILTYSA